MSFTMYGGSIAQFPYRFDRLEDELGTGVERAADTLEITDVTDVTDLEASRSDSDPLRHVRALVSGP